MALETQTPPRTIYRVAHTPDAWDAPGWSRAQSDGTFGNQFDAPDGLYRPTPARDPPAFWKRWPAIGRIYHSLQNSTSIDGDDNFIPFGEVPQECSNGACWEVHRHGGRYADIYASEWIAFLRHKLAAEWSRLGLSDLDSFGSTAGHAPRITQLASSRAFKLGYPGIYYRSRYATI